MCLTILNTLAAVEFSGVLLDLSGTSGPAGNQGATVQKVVKINGRMVSVQAAADMLGVSAKTIRRRIADGVIKGYRFGPRILRVDPDEVKAALRVVGGAL